jgi:hypothetical protein
MPFDKFACRPIGLAILAAASVGLSACSQSTDSYVVSQPAEHRPAPADKYPDFSRPLSSAMPQMTNEEAARMETQLSALARQRRNGSISEAEYWQRVRELQALAKGSEQ